MIQLRHPGSDEGSYFVLKCETDLSELLTFAEKHRSWFFNDTVASNGQIYIPIPIDPLYFMVSLLTKDTTKAVPLDHLLEDSDFPSMKTLLKVLQSVDICIVADQKGPDDLKAFKFNEEKTLNWLKTKCNLVVEALKQSKVNTGGNVTSSTFVNLENNNDDLSVLAAAFGIVSEYLSLEMSQKLRQHLNLPDEQKIAANKRKSVVELETPAIKKPRPSEEAKAKPKEDKKAKDLAKAASGTKNIMSFFKKK